MFVVFHQPDNVEPIGVLNNGTGRIVVKTRQPGETTRCVFKCTNDGTIRLIGHIHAEECCKPRLKTKFSGRCPFCPDNTEYGFGICSKCSFSELRCMQCHQLLCGPPKGVTPSTYTGTLIHNLLNDLPGEMVRNPCQKEHKDDSLCEVKKSLQKMEAEQRKNEIKIEILKHIEQMITATDRFKKELFLSQLTKNKEAILRFLNEGEGSMKEDNAYEILENYFLGDSGLRWKRSAEVTIGMLRSIGIKDDAMTEPEDGNSYTVLKEAIQNL